MIQSFNLDTKLLDNVIVNESCDHLVKKQVKTRSKFTQKTTEIIKWDLLFNMWSMDQKYQHISII